MEGAYVRGGLALMVMAVVVFGVAPAAAEIVDDTEERIRSHDMGTFPIGDTVTLSGTTNVAAGDRLLIEVTSASFEPTDKAEGRKFSGTSGTVTVQEGRDANTWSMEIDTTGWRGDTYTVTIESIDTGTSATSTFTLVERTPGPSPTSPPPATTPPPSTGPAASPTPPAPGWGTLTTLAGAGAAALLALCRH
ncbi:MAG: hypothetical protein ACP5C4_08825 [Methanomicrobiales archaeon]